MAQPGGSNSSDGTSAYKQQRKHDYRRWTSFWMSSFTTAWLHSINLAKHITWFVSVFWDDCSVSSTLRCRRILKFLSRLASFCCTSRWWDDSLEKKSLEGKYINYKNRQKISSGMHQKAIFQLFLSINMSSFFLSGHAQRTILDKTLNIDKNQSIKSTHTLYM